MWQPRDSNSAAASPASSTTRGSTRAYPRSAVHATLSPFTSTSHASRYEPGSRGSERRSRSSPPAMTSSISAASRTVRVTGPTWETWAKPLGKPLRSGTRPYEGLKPYTPQNAAGMRIEPPPSVPSASGPQPLATAAAAPPLEPPGVSAGFHGFRVTPKSGFSVTALWPNSDVLVLPRSTAPAAFRRATAIASSSGTWSAKSREPPVVVSPRVKRTSLIETGTPWSGPSGSPFVTAISASRAAVRARSAATTQNALSVGLSASIRDKTAFAISTGESFLARTRRLGGRAPHRLRGARLGAYRSHSVARRARAPAARGRHRRAESDRRARPGTRRGPARLSRPLPYRAALPRAPRVVPLRARGRPGSARGVYGRRARLDARAPRASLRRRGPLRPASRPRGEGGLRRRGVLPAGLAVRRASRAETRARRLRGRPLLALGPRPPAGGSPAPLARGRPAARSRAGGGRGSGTADRARHSGGRRGGGRCGERSAARAYDRGRRARDRARVGRRHARPDPRRAGPDSRLRKLPPRARRDARGRGRAWPPRHGRPYRGRGARGASRR